jgi:hypothetical protein
MLRTQEPSDSSWHMNMELSGQERHQKEVKRIGHNKPHREAATVAHPLFLSQVYFK